MLDQVVPDTTSLQQRSNYQVKMKFTFRLKLYLDCNIMVLDNTEFNDKLGYQHKYIKCSINCYLNIQSQEYLLKPSEHNKKRVCL